MLKKYVTIAAVGVCLAAGCAKGPAANSAAAVPQQTGDAQFDPAAQLAEAPRITLADAKKDFDAGTALFIDTRGAESYNQEHIAGAINITADDLKANLNKIPKDKKVIAYCS